MEHKKWGLYFKLDKDACMSCNSKALHKCFWIFLEKILSEIQQDFDESKRGRSPIKIDHLLKKDRSPVKVDHILKKDKSHMKIN